MPTDDRVLNLVLAELRDTKYQLKQAVERIDDDMQDLYYRVEQIETGIMKEGLSFEKIREIEEFKKKVGEILTFDDMKKMKDEREESIKFRSKVYATAAAYAAGISLLISLLAIYFTRTH